MLLKPHGRARDRAPLITFLVLVACALPLMVWAGHHRWFIFDEWDFLALRQVGNAGDLLRPFNGHVTTLPIVVYRLIFGVVGLHSYVPYLVVVVVAHLVVAVLLRAVMVRAGAGAWLSTLAAATFLFFGSGAANIIVAFQMTFVGALAFGLAWLLLADHDGPIERRDWFGLAAGAAALLCSGIGIVMVGVVGLTMLLRRGWRVALFHVAPPAVFFLVLSAVAPEGTNDNIYLHGSRSEQIRSAKFVGVGIGSAFGRLGRVPFVGFVVAAILAAGFALLFLGKPRATLSGPLAAPLALLLGGIAFLVMTGETRAEPAAAARLSRYVYIVVALALPAIAVAAQALIQRWGRVMAVAVVAVFAVGLLGNFAAFVNIGRPAAWPAGAPVIEQGRVARTDLLTAASLPLASQLPREIQPSPYYAAGATLGWLLDSKADGQLPSPGPLSADTVANETLLLALQSSDYVLPPRQCYGNKYAYPECWPSIATKAVRHIQHGRKPAACRTITAASEVVLQRGDPLEVKAGVVDIVYQAPDGGVSAPRQLAVGTVAALAGPLRLQVAPAPVSPGGQAVICS